MRIRLPRAPRESTAPLPAALRWDAPPATVALLLGRRDFLKALALVLGSLALPFTRAERALAKARGGFFTKRERRTLEALVDRILPPDDAPGATDLGVARYVEGLLTALERKRKTRLFAGGPFSGRTPFPDPETGTPSRRRPKNSFKKFVPPTRLQELWWRGELYGTASVAELAALDAQAGAPKTGLRDLYRAALAKVDEVAEATRGAAFAALAPADQDEVVAMLDAGAFAPDPRRGGATFMDVLTSHVMEGCFSAPEYGGNAKGRGWALVGLEGDSQPLGYSVFDATTGAYVERAQHPMSTPNPDELGAGGAVLPKALSADGQKIQDGIVTATSFFSDGSIC